MKSLILFVWIAGCTSVGSVSVDEHRPLIAPAFEHPNLVLPSDDEVGVDETGDVDGAIDLGPSRPRRRLDVDQLDASLRTVLGISWTERRNELDVDMIAALSQTLGKPDYIGTTEENLESSPLFEKFLRDAANATCARRVVLDRDAYRPTDRVLLANVNDEDTTATNATAVDANLQQLLLRFHARRVEGGSAELARWRWLFDEATRRGAESELGGPLTGWRTVCVALVTHPDFYTY